MPDTFWYIVAVKGETFVSIWKRRWLPVSQDAYNWDNRKTAKDVAQALRKRYPKKSIRVVSDKELAPWFVGEALEPKVEGPGMFTKFAAPLVRQIYPKLIMSRLVSVQPMVLGPKTLVEETKS